MLVSGDFGRGKDSSIGAADGSIVAVIFSAMTGLEECCILHTDPGTTNREGMISCEPRHVILNLSF